MLNNIKMSSSKLFRKHISEPWFSLIMIRSKTIEGRLNQGDWAEMREGDRIDWVNEDFGLKREFRTMIVSKNVYPSFENYLHSEGLHKTLPSIEKLEDGLKIYRSFYKPEEETKYSVVALELKVFC
jgi:ASC-1-like (ASCH) protein